MRIYSRIRSLLLNSASNRLKLTQVTNGYQWIHATAQNRFQRHQFLLYSRNFNGLLCPRSRASRSFQNFPIVRSVAEDVCLGYPPTIRHCTLGFQKRHFEFFSIYFRGIVFPRWRASREYINTPMGMSVVEGVVLCVSGTHQLLCTRDTKHTPLAPDLPCGYFIFLSRPRSGTHKSSTRNLKTFQNSVSSNLLTCVR